MNFGYNYIKKNENCSTIVNHCVHFYGFCKDYTFRFSYYCNQCLSLLMCEKAIWISRAIYINHSNWVIWSVSPMLRKCENCRFESINNIHSLSIDKSSTASLRHYQKIRYISIKNMDTFLWLLYNWQLQMDQFSSGWQLFIFTKCCFHF